MAEPSDPGPDLRLESLRIQAAAVVAQQAALDEKELRITEREAALTRQEEQLAGRLEGQRRQLLELQDQITHARAALRQKRAAHAAVAEHEARELTRAREDAAELQRSAKAERRRLIDLRRRLLQRARRHWQANRKAAEAKETELRQQADRLAAERTKFGEQVQQANSHIELEKRRLADAWRQFDRAQRAWQERRTSEDTAAAVQVRDLARRAKAVAAAERKTAAEQADAAQQLADRRQELEQLETRIGNARLRLLEHHAETLAPPPPATEDVVSPTLLPAVTATGLEQREAQVQRRAETLALVSDDLADQRLHLAEQVERLLLTQQLWHADRTAALRDLDTFAVRFEARELELDRRGRELQSTRAAVQDEYLAAGQMRLRLEAELAWAESREADRRIRLDAFRAELHARAQVLAAQEDRWRSLLRRWGRRRHEEILRLRAEQQACRQERSEWAAARTVWLRLVAKQREQRRAVAARSLALEQYRADAGGPAAAKRLERLERQWSAHCETSARDLERLQATLTAEAVRLDEVSGRVRRDMIAAEARAAILDNRAAEVEREEQLFAAEKARAAGEMLAVRARHEAAELQAAAAREEAERLARLLIDAVPPAMPVQPSQAA
ncbi:MAG TPA: hypothetical protein VH120_05010 [Gemmataceae bacterium]|nr:hypothetical protein [Gemmataceae bacterium]